MNLKYIHDEIDRLKTLVDGWSTLEEVSAIERDLALEKLRGLYEALRFETSIAEESTPEEYDEKVDAQEVTGVAVSLNMEDMRCLDLNPQFDILPTDEEAVKEDLTGEDFVGEESAEQESLEDDDVAMDLDSDVIFEKEADETEEEAVAGDSLEENFDEDELASDVEEVVEDEVTKDEAPEQEDAEQEGADAEAQPIDLIGFSPIEEEAEEETEEEAPEDLTEEEQPTEEIVAEEPEMEAVEETEEIVLEPELEVAPEPEEEVLETAVAPDPEEEEVTTEPEIKIETEVEVEVEPETEVAPETEPEEKFAPEVKPAEPTTYRWSLDDADEDAVFEVVKESEVEQAPQPVRRRVSVNGQEVELPMDNERESKGDFLEATLFGMEERSSRHRHKQRVLMSLYDADEPSKSKDDEDDGFDFELESVATTPVGYELPKSEAEHHHKEEPLKVALLEDDEDEELEDEVFELEKDGEEEISSQPAMPQEEDEEEPITIKATSINDLLREDEALSEEGEIEQDEEDAPELNIRLGKEVDLPLSKPLPTAEPQEEEPNEEEPTEEEPRKEEPEEEPTKEEPRKEEPKPISRVAQIYGEEPHVASQHNPQTMEQTPSGAVLGEVLGANVQTLGDVMTPQKDVSSKLNHIDSLESAIGLNDKFLLIRDLFQGDIMAYNVTMQRLDSFDDLDDCLIFISENYHWNPSSDGAQLLTSLLERKFE